MKKEKVLVLGVALTDDPVEIHIIKFFDRLLNQNKRLTGQIKKTGAWTGIKDIATWKPYDFYNYFCNLYSDKFGREFRLHGNVTREYKRISSFMKQNKIDNPTYKDFMERAFSRRFNAVNLPSIGSVCSPSLFSFLMKKSARSATPLDLMTLDNQMERENEKYEEKSKAHGLEPVMTVGKMLERLNA